MSIYGAFMIGVTAGIVFETITALVGRRILYIMLGGALVISLWASLTTAGQATFEPRFNIPLFIGVIVGTVIGGHVRREIMVDGTPLLEHLWRNRLTDK